MRIAQLVIAPVPVRAARRGRRAGRERARRPRVRVVARVSGCASRESGCRRSCAGGGASCSAAREGRREVWLLPGGGVRSGESLLSALQRELEEETGSARHRRRGPARGAGRARRLDRSRARAPGASTSSTSSSLRTSRGSLEDVASQDTAVRGHRRVPTAGARRDLAAPADPALPPALAAGRPVGVPRRDVGP